MSESRYDHKDIQQSISKPFETGYTIVSLYIEENVLSSILTIIHSITQLIIGNYGLSYDEQRVQMAMWAIMASPLIMSTDLKNIKQESKELLLNKNVIKINPRCAGVHQGHKTSKGIAHRDTILVLDALFNVSCTLIYSYVNTLSHLLC